MSGGDDLQRRKPQRPKKDGPRSAPEPKPRGYGDKMRDGVKDRSKKHEHAPMSRRDEDSKKDGGVF